MSLNSSTLFKSIAIIAILLLCSCTKIGSSTCLTTNPTTWNLSESLISTLNMINSTSTSAAKTIFTNMSVGGTPLTSIIQGLLTLYIIFYGIQFMFGMIQTPQMDFVIRIMKIGTVIALISPNSWYFFNSYLFTIFINSISSIIAYINPNASANPIAFADQILQAILLDPYTYIRIIALSFTSSIGPAFALLLLFGICSVFRAIFGTLLSYIMSFLYISLLISLAPIFITCLLFEFSEDLFKNWIRSLARATFEPILLIAGMVFLTDLMILAISNVLNFTVCYKCIFNVSLANVPIIPCIYGYMVGGYDNTGGGILPLIFFNFSGVMLFLIVATLMPKYAGLAAGISLNIFGGSPDASPLGTGGKATHGLEQGSLSVVGMDDKTRKKRSQENKLEEDHQKKTQDPKDSPKK